MTLFGIARLWPHLISLAQSVLKIGSALAERDGQGEVGGCTPLGDSAWWLLQLGVEKPGQRRVGHLSAFLHKQA